MTDIAGINACIPETSFVGSGSAAQFSTNQEQNRLPVTTMRSRPTTPCTPLSPSSENPLTRRARLLLGNNTDCDHSDNKYKKPTPSFQRLISENTSTVIKCVVVISLALNLVSIPSLFAVIFGPLWFNSCTHGEGLSDSVCLPCGETGIPGVPTTRTENGYCCTKASDPNLQPLLKKKLILLSPHRGSTFNADCETDKNASPDRKRSRPVTLGRLILDVKRTKTENEFKWLNKSPTGLAFLQGDLYFANESIRVLKGGIFRIRSHLSFDSYNNAFPSASKTAHIITHQLVKMSCDGLTSRAEKIMMEKIMMELSTYQSSDLDLTVKLRANESVLVQVDTYRFLYNYDIANTFEIQRL